jgi:hypothetical protein
LDLELEIHFAVEDGDLELQNRQELKLLADSTFDLSGSKKHHF